MQHYFHNKHILMGITGSIAAYKLLDISSRLVQLGGKVKVILTKSAIRFVTPVSIRSLTHDEVLTDLFTDPLAHIRLAKWADVILVAPASAHFMARYALGMCDDLLCTTLLASTRPVMVAPAMNQAMWQQESVQAHVNTLQKRGVSILAPEWGKQACGDVGPGRLCSQDTLLMSLPRAFVPKLLAGKRLLITAGPTREHLDPVRYLSNVSSGKMGHALACSAYYHGAQVVLIWGAGTQTPPPFCQTICIETASALQAALAAQIDKTDIMIGCAAVCDVKPARFYDHKVKKQQLPEALPLVHNTDMIAALGKRAKKPFLVGFAAETQDVVENARAKLWQKNLDLIVANRVGPGVGMGQDKQAAFVIDRKNTQPIPYTTKAIIADAVIHRIAQALGPGLK